MAADDENDDTNSAFDRRGGHDRSTRARLIARLEEISGGGEFARLDEALTHPSFGNETRAADNQRLEFLGDAVLGLCVSELLATAYPLANEGELTRMRSALVNAEALAKWGRAEAIGGALSLGRGARAGGERDQVNVIADAVEAIVAAVFDARGLDGARKLVHEIVREPMRLAEETGALDPKSELQERLQAAGGSAPIYKVLDSKGPPHDPTFEVEVMIDGEPAARGEGRSKRMAEREAAKNALAALYDRDRSRE
jgi:ribonuclease-3